LLSFKTKFNFYFKKDLSQITRVLYVWSKGSNLEI
jgi:hypothetical protein